MSFTGDLQHLPIVDVIQLLHSTRKSGILRVNSRKGESQLVFKDGYIVSANHLNNSIRIGQILVDLGIITPELLDHALQEQKNAGTDRKPLVITLVEKGLVKENDAYKGLEHLIEMTIVEILTWKKGTFILEVLTEAVSDEYRYYPEHMSREINIDTQSVLMDSLRIFDEKMRDGELTEEDDEGVAGQDETGEEGGPTLSAEDLGLDDLDHLEAKLPKQFAGLAEFDPKDLHRQKIQESMPGLAAEELEALTTFLARFATEAGMGGRVPQRESQAQALIFVSTDEFLIHAVTTVCTPAGIIVSATDGEQGLDPLIAQSLAKKHVPLVLFDAPGTDEHLSPARLAILRRQTFERHPGIVAVQLGSAGDYSFALEAYADGARAVIPRPVAAHRDSFVRDAILFLETFPSYVQGQAGGRTRRLVGRLKESLAALREVREIPDVAAILLRHVATTFERSVTLVVRETELIAEKGIGVRGEKSLGPTPPLGFRIPLATSSIFREVVAEGRLFYGQSDDEVLKNHLFAAIGAPRHPAILILPLRSRGKTIALTYGDFGDRETDIVETELLEILVNEADLALENTLYRKKLA